MLKPNIFSLSKGITYYCILSMFIFMLAPASASGQEAIITGSILHDRTGEPLIGANVLIEDTRFGAATNIDGEFTIRVPGERVTGQEVTLVARFIGFRTARQRITLEAGTQTVNFSLREDVLGFDEVIVTGQAIGSSRREIGSAVASISSEDVELAPIQNLSQLLQSRIPGASITPTSGQAGHGSRILLRGIASLSQANTPIVYVDGVRIDNTTAAGIRTTGLSWSTLDDINPQDIERVEIVRGASAATMYGTEAAAGVIQIFTKRGRDVRPQWTFRSELGYNSIPSAWWEASGSVFAPWFADAYSSTAPQVLNQLSVAGGTEGWRYYVSGTLRNNQGVLPNNSEDYASVRSNIQLTVRDNLTVGTNLSYSSREVQQTADGNNQEGITINALVGGPNGQFNPIEDVLELEHFFRGYRFNGGVNVEYALTQNFTHRLSAGLDYTNSDNTQFLPPDVIPRFSGGYKGNYRRNSINLNVDYIATYRTAITRGIRSTTNAGFQGFDRTVNSNSAFGENFPFLGLSNVSAAADVTGGESRFEERSLGLFAEQQFGFNDMFYITFGARGDAHSAFGAEVSYAIYPKVDVSYIISEHDFWDDRFGSLRLRGSYGTAGMQPGAFDAVRTWSPIAAIGGVPAVTPGNIGNPDLEPEVSHEYEVGIDAEFLNRRVVVEATYYYQLTEKALHFRGLPPSEGFPGHQLENIGEVENEGIEASVKLGIIDNRTIRWSVFSNFHFTRNLVVSLGGGRPLNPRWTQFTMEGFPVAAFFGNRWVEQTDDEGNLIAVRYSDIAERDEDGNLPEGWDYIGPAQPTRSIQFGSNLNVTPSWSFNIIFDYQGGHFTQNHTTRWLMDPRRNIQEDYYFNDELIVTAGPVHTDCRDVDEALDPVTYILCTTPSAIRDGDFVTHADFVKLREVSLGYRLPSDLVRGFGLTSFTVNLSGRNLWRWLRDDTLDVEANLNAASTHQRQSYFPTPTPRQWVFGISAQF